MRALLWLLGLFGLATLLALFAGNNQAVVTLYWPPHTAIDLSFNLVLMLAGLLFLLFYVVLHALMALRTMPRQAIRWRQQQKERALHGHLLNALSYFLAGRYARSRKAALQALRQEEALEDAVANAPAGHIAVLPYRMQLRALAHYMVAESSQAMQEADERDAHHDQALAMAALANGDAAAETSEGIQLRAARWAVEQRDLPLALQRLEALPHAASRRILALRHKLKAARLQGKHALALETARVLARHKAFPGQSGHVLVNQLAVEWLASVQDPDSLQAAWRQLDARERAHLPVALQAAERLVALHGDHVLARAWLLPAWQQLADQPDSLTAVQRSQLARTLESTMEDMDTDWLQRIEQAHMRWPNQPLLQYLMGMACVKRQLWGKAQSTLGQAIKGLQQEPAMRRRAWQALAIMAEQREDASTAHDAWKQAALID